MKLKLEDVQDFIQITNVSKNALNAVNSYIYYLSDVTRQQSSVNNVKNKKANNIPEELDYSQIKTLSTEVLEKINKVKPRTIEQLERIAGVTPAAVASIIHYLTKNRKIIN
jgi:tRNA uridine 5-carboxymethylaminomethyl modification enzyme